jgi:hypothetical protein
MPGIEGDPSQVCRITVPGGFGFGKRDYPLVLDTIPGLIDRVDPDRFKIAVVGGGADRARLEEVVASRGLTEVFDFAPVDPETGAVPSDEYHPRLAGSTFLLPCFAGARAFLPGLYLAGAFRNMCEPPPSAARGGPGLHQCPGPGRPSPA